MGGSAVYFQIQKVFMRGTIAAWCVNIGKSTSIQAMQHWKRLSLSIFLLPVVS